jgi:hypothetical protein
LCGRKGHVVQRCFKRFDQSFSGEEKVVASTTTSYEIDTNWYVDFGATDHITSDLDKLSVRDKYVSNDQVHTVSDSGMEIQHDGNSTLHTPSCDLILKSILHVPAANKILISIHHLPMKIMYFLNFTHAFSN